MGGTQSTNTARAIINASQTVTNNVEQCCKISGKQEIGISCPKECFKNCTNPAQCCKIENSEFLNSEVFSSSCKLSATASSQIKQNIQQSIKQEAIAAAAGLGLSGTDASNIISASIKAANSIGNNFTQVINQAAEQSINVSGCVISGSTFQNTLVAAQQAEQTAKITNEATQSVEQSIKQTAVSINLGILGLLIGVALVIIALGWFLKDAGKGLFKLLIPVGIAGGGYLVYAGVTGAPPWKTSSQKGKLTISPTTLPRIKAGKNYNETLKVSGGKSPYQWSIPDVVENQVLNSIGLQLVADENDSSKAYLKGKVSSNPGVDSVTFNVYVNDSSGDKSQKEGYYTGYQKYSVNVNDKSGFELINGARDNDMYYYYNGNPIYNLDNSSSNTPISCGCITNQSSCT